VICNLEGEAAMSITNEDRYHLQERATEVLGTKEAPR
jgi:hypothetical protein